MATLECLSIYSDTTQTKHYTQQITNQFTQIPLPDTHTTVKTCWNNHNKDIGSSQAKF